MGEHGLIAARHQTQDLASQRRVCAQRPPAQRRTRLRHWPRLRPVCARSPSVMGL